jgi:hypothetical protein
LLTLTIRGVGVGASDEPAGRAANHQPDDHPDNQQRYIHALMRQVGFKVVIG